MRSTSPLKSRAWRKLSRDPVARASFTIVFFYGILALGAAFGWWASEWNELQTNGHQPASVAHWFGTNWNGQDILARTIFSTKTAFVVGFVVAFGATFLGGVLGAFAGFFAGTWIDELIQWFYSCLDAIPFYLFVAAVQVAMGDQPYSMHFAMIATLWTATARFVRAEVMKLREIDFVTAARATGVENGLIVMRHILPNTTHLLLVQLTITFISAIKTEVILSFLGLGVKEGISWGLMLSEASQEIASGMYNNFLAASGFLFVLVMAFNFFADALQDALDPKNIA